MAYNEFTLDMLLQQFELQIREHPNLFAEVEPVVTSELLHQILGESISLALDISTEKARSEFIIAPVLMELRRQFGGKISLFSGIEFNVDIARGLRGVCDFLISLSPLQLMVQAPVIAVVEAKNENIKLGLYQCIAELVAAQQFNRDRGNHRNSVYGVVTTGSLWKFLQLTGAVVSVDQAEYHIKEIDRIVGILMTMVRDAKAIPDGPVEVVIPCLDHLRPDPSGRNPSTDSI